MADDIIKTLIAEAYGEGPEAMRLVAETILNRAAIRGLTPEQVVRQSNQYTGLTSPGAEAKKAWSNPTALAAAQAAWELAQQPGDPTKGADHYYAPGTISQPYWAKSMTPTIEAGGHKFYASRPVPPGEIPNTVGTALSTVPTPQPPVPVTPSIDMAQMRRILPPTQLIPDTFASIAKPKRYLGDEIGMSPIVGGKQDQPMFDAAFDTRVGAMRPTNYPVQGSQVGASKAPAPVPRIPSAQLAAERAKDPVLQAALNAKYPAQLPPLPPATRPVATTVIRPSASDLVRGNPMQTKSQVTTVASYPTTPKVSASDLVRGKSGISTVATYPTTGFPTTAQITAATGFRPPPAIPERLPVGQAGLPALYGTGNVAGVGTKAVAPAPFQRPPSFAPATQIAQPKVAPVPFNRPTAVGTQLAVQPMPPMPIPRPPMGMGGAEKPSPMPVMQSPAMMLQRGLQAVPGVYSQPAIRPPSTGYTTIIAPGGAVYDSANGVWLGTNSGSGSGATAHGGSDNNKHAGQSLYGLGRSY